MKARISLLLLSILIGAAVSITGYLSGIFHPIVGFSLSVGVLIGFMAHRDGGDLAMRVLAAFVVSFVIAVVMILLGYKSPHLDWYRFYSVFFFLFLPITAYNVVIWIRNEIHR